MTASVLEFIGLLACCSAAAIAINSSSPKVRVIALATALVVAPVLVAGDVWDESRFVDLRAHPALVAAGLAVACAVIALGALVFRRIPVAMPILAFVALPLRAPLNLGGETSHLLVPLYAVIAAGAVSFAYATLVVGAADSRRAVAPSPSATWTLRLLGAVLVLYALQSAYSEDVSNAIENTGFFLIPFAGLLVLLLEVRWTPRLLGWVLAATVVVELLLCAVAFWEYASRDLLLNQQLLDANQLHLYFRVNSLFFDPNVFGRYLALTLVALGAYLAWARDLVWGVIAAAVSGILLVALELTLSLTSFAALIAGLLVVTMLRWGYRWGAAALLATALVGVIFLVASGAGSSELGSAHRVDAATSGRVDLVEGGVDLAADRPGWGWGSGSFGAAFRRHIKEAQTTNSHSEPITVAAEQGVIGLVVYVGLLVVALVTLFAGARVSLARTAIAACFVAMIVHSLGYAGFVIDPATWALLALGIALAD